jgi:hypothetical protein
VAPTAPWFLSAFDFFNFVRPPPAFQITINRFEIWRGFLICLSALLICVLCTWCWASGVVWWIAVGAFITSVFGVVGLFSLFRVHSFSLRWDTQLWGCGTAAQRGHEPSNGYVAVSIDLGFWMLLRFSPAPSSLGRGQWLPVQRRGHEPMWHAFRATVHGAASTCRM